MVYIKPNKWTIFFHVFIQNLTKFATLEGLKDYLEIHQIIDLLSMPYNIKSIVSNLKALTLTQFEIQFANNCEFIQTWIIRNMWYINMAKTKQHLNLEHTHNVDSWLKLSLSNQGEMAQFQMD
jgi:hypothetical protein